MAAWTAEPQNKVFRATTDACLESLQPESFLSHHMLSERCRQLSEYREERLVYFLDGSRHVYKVDDIAFSHGGRISVYPVLAGQIGVARRIIAQNDFSESVVAGAVYEEVREVLRYYMLPKTK